MSRWATVAVIFGVLVAGVLYDRVDLAPEPDPLPVAPRVVSPVLVEPAPLSSAWYCPVGSATAEGLITESRLTITNLSEADATARVDLMTEEGAGGGVVLGLPASSTVAFTPESLSEAEVVGSAVEIIGASGVVSHRVRTSTGFAEGTCASATSDTWYFADAVTTRDATAVVALMNPFAQDVVFSMSFQTSTRTREPEDLKAAVVPGRSVRLVDVGQYVAREPNVAVTIETVQGRLAVERLQGFDGALGPVGTTIQMGATDPSLVWTFPAGRVHEAGGSRMVVFNPNETVAQFDLEFLLDPEDRSGFGLVPLEASAQPGRQVVIDISELFDTYDIPVPYDLGLRIRSADGNPIVAERWSVSPPIDETLIGAGGSEARIAPVRFRQSDVDPEEVPEEEIDETPDVSTQATPDMGVSSSRGSEVATERWVIPWVTAALDPGESGDAEALSYVVVTGDEGTLVELEGVIGGGRLPPSRAVIPASGMAFLPMPTISPEVAALLVANAPVTVEVQMVIPGARTAVVPAVPRLTEEALDEVRTPAGETETELPVSVVDPDESEPADDAGEPEQSDDAEQDDGTDDTGQVEETPSEVEE